MIKTITSAANPLIQKIVKLQRSKYRSQYREFIAEGIRVIETLIDAQHKPSIIFLTEKLLPYAQKYSSLNQIVLISETLMKKISSTETPSGIMALFSIPIQQPLDTLSSGIVLMNMQNPGNAGALMRTAVAMNKKTAVFIDSVDPWNPKTVHASAGAIGHINIFKCTWKELIEHKHSLPLCALVVADGKDPADAMLHNSLIVVGNEGAGLSDETVAQCNEKITLNMPGHFESLNAAVAGSIALYLSATKK